MDANLTLRLRQRGIVLFVSLALLLALTLGALGAAQTTVLELRMARNAQDAALAFHAAESALVRAETALAAGVVVDVLAAPVYGEVAPWRESDWRGADDSDTIVESVAAIQALLTPDAPVDVYRVTARGVGPGGAVVLLQSTVGVAAAPGADATLVGRLSWVRLD